jgi:hypothetical protein
MLPLQLMQPVKQIVIFGFPGHSKFLEVFRLLQTTSVTYPSLKTRSDASFYVHFKNVAPATNATRQTNRHFSLPGALKIFIGFSASTDHERYISVT